MSLLNNRLYDSSNMSCAVIFDSQIIQSTPSPNPPQNPCLTDHTTLSALPPVCWFVGLLVCGLVVERWLTSRAREALKSCLPDPLRNASFAQVLKDDTSTKRCLAQLLYNLSDQMGQGGGGNQLQ